MKESKKTMLVIAVTLLLAAALFVGAGAAADVAPTYWQKTVTTEPTTGYSFADGTVNISTEDGLAYFGYQVMSGAYKEVANLTVNIEANLDMGAHYWIPLTSKDVTINEKDQTAIIDGEALLMNVTFDGKNHTISNLKVNTTREYTGASTLGANNNYCAGFIGYTHIPMEFKNLTFKDADVTPDFTYGLNDQTDPKGYNQIGGIVGLAVANVTFNNVSVSGEINGSSKVAPFVGHVSNAAVTFTNCSADAIVRGLDSLGGLIGYVQQQAPTVDDATKNNIGISFQLPKNISEDTVDYEMLGYIDGNDEAKELWNDDGTLVTIPDDTVIKSIVKGDWSKVTEGKFTDVKIRNATAGYYNYDAGSGYATKSVSLYKFPAQDIEIRSTAEPATFEPVAKIGDKEYTTLAAAVAAAADGDTIKLLKNVTNGAGLKIGDNDSITREITIDLGGFTYTIDGAKAIGADANHQTQGIRVGNAQVVTIQNGTLDITNNDQTSGQRVVWLINNYGTLTLGDKVSINGSKVSKYAIETDENVNAVVFSNTGSVDVTGNTSITAPTDVPALYVGWFKDYPKKGSPSGTVCANGTNATIDTTGMIDGDVAFKMYYSNDPTNAELTANGPKLTITAGNIKGSLVVDGIDAFKNYAKETGIKVSGGKFVGNPKDYVAPGYHVEEITGGTYQYEVFSGYQPPKIDVESDYDPETEAATIKSGTTATAQIDPNDPKQVIIKDATANVEIVVKSSSDWTESGGTISGTADSVTAYYPPMQTAIDGEPINVALILDLKPEALANSGIVLPLIDTTFNTEDADAVEDDTHEAVATITGKDNGDTPIDEINAKLKKVTLAFIDVAAPGSGYRYVVFHVGTDSVVKVKSWGEKEGDTLSFESDKGFSSYVLATEVVSHGSSGSSSSQGSSVWLTNDTPAEPKVTPTPTPTPGAAETPSVKPIENPSDVPAKTPAPFLGILAGLGAAAVVFGLRRK